MLAARLSLLLRRERPPASKKMHMKGKVARVKNRRPLVSIKNRVGMVKTTWIAPYPKEAYRASSWL